MTRSLVSASAIAMVSCWALSDSRGQPAPADPTINAPVYYAEQVLVVSDEQGTAVIKLNSTDDGEKVGAHYRYRYLSAEGKESAGEGDVYETRKQSAPNKTTIVAGSISLTWSRGMDQFGWIYYLPEELTVQMINTEFYDKLDLRRFRR